MKKILMLITVMTVIATSCSKKTTPGVTSKGATFYELKFQDHVINYHWPNSFLMGIQIYGDRRFLLSHIDTTKGTGLSAGVVLIDNTQQFTGITFPDRVKGVIIAASSNKEWLQVQFHKGGGGKIGPPLWFRNSGDGYVLTPAKGKKQISSMGKYYDSNSWDVKLLFKIENRQIVLAPDEWTVSGVDVNGTESEADSTVNDSGYPDTDSIPPVPQVPVDSISVNNTSQQSTQNQNVQTPTDPD